MLRYYIWANLSLAKVHSTSRIISTYLRSTLEKILLTFEVLTIDSKTQVNYCGHIYLPNDSFLPTVRFEVI